MTGKQLKNSILQWAIQGKLVPQDPKDEPASVLLEKIRAEKARLVKEGKIKRDKKESIIYRGEDNSYYEKFADGKVVCIDDEIPFEIPNGWRWARLGWVFELRSGQDFPPEKYNDKSIGTPYITGASNIDGNVIIQNRWTEYPSVIAPEGCLLLVCKGSGVGKMCYMNIPKAHIARQIQAIIPFTTNIIIDFLRFAIECRLIEITSQANGVIPGISREATLSFLLPIPPLKEQIRIVEKLKRIEPLVSQYGICESKLKHINSEILSSFRKSILQEAIKGSLVKQDPNDEPAFVLLQRIKEEKLRLVKEGKLKKKDVIDNNIFRGDDNKYYEQIGKNLIDITDDIPFDIPSNWVWTRIGYLFAHNNGKQLNKGNSAGTLMEYITTSNLYWDGFKLDYLKMMPFEESEIERCQAIKGDLLVCEGGDVGRSCIWTYDYPIMLQNHIHKLRAYLPLCTKYFFYIFYLYNLIGLIGGKGIGIQGFSAKALHNTIIPLPPLKEQERIVKKIETVLDKIKVV